MRTTLTLDDDVARLIHEAVHEQRRSINQIVNEALRRALGPRVPEEAPYVLESHAARPRPGIDRSGFNRLADDPDLDDR